MRYYRGIDYYLYFVDFPNRSVRGLITANSDGTASIYINTLHTRERQEKALRHELRHLVRQHQYCDWKTLYEKEEEAEEDDTDYLFGENYSYAEYIGPAESGPTAEKNAPRPEEPARKLPNVFQEKPPGTIPYFNSLEIFRDYMYAMREQYRKGVGEGKCSAKTAGRR